MALRLIVAGVLLLAALVVVSELVARKHRRSILAEAAKPDPDGWSMAMRGWDYREKWELILAGVDPTPLDSPIYDEMEARYLTEPQRELPAAPKRRTRRPKTTVGSES